MTDRRLLSVDEAAELLRLSPASVEALVGAGYLPSDADDEEDALTIALSDLKAFVARNVTGGRDDPDVAGLLAGVELSAEDPTAGTAPLLDGLIRHVDTMADRALHIFTAAFPDAQQWPDRRKERFVEQARDRFEAIIAVARQGDSVADELLSDLADVGAAAAISGAPLPEVLVTLRISRDLVVQTAVDLADERGHHGGLALSLLLTQVLPAMDRLTDAVTRGYWSAVVQREEESWARYAHVVESSSDGVFEVDIDGVITYANPSLALILGHDAAGLVGRPITDVLVPAEAGTIGDALLAVEPDGEWRDFTARRTDGVVRLLEIRLQERLHHRELAGFDGVVRDVTAARDLERQKNDFLALITHELRQPLTTILGLGITLDSYAGDLTEARVERIGRTIHQQAERIARLADDLFDISRLEANALLVNLRTVDLRAAVEAALGMVDAADVVACHVPADVRVRADSRRLEQIVAHLVENALRHGAPPVSIEASAEGTQVVVRVIDHGAGVPAGADETMFHHLRPTVGAPRIPRAGGLGLPLARGLVEAMGGRLHHEPNPAGGAVFGVTLPQA